MSDSRVTDRAVVYLTSTLHRNVPIARDVTLVTAIGTEESSLLVRVSVGRERLFNVHRK